MQYNQTYDTERFKPILIYDKNLSYPRMQCKNMPAYHSPVDVLLPKRSASFAWRPKFQTEHRPREIVVSPDIHSEKRKKKQNSIKNNG